ncbi:hypothetical protein EJB05_53154, partial [Eragrostis curvula]
MDLAPFMPDDVLVDILRRLAPRCIAASRCVCKAWCLVVDNHRLLRADLLPLSLGGIFLNHQDLWSTQFLCRPTTGAAVSGRLDHTVPGESDYTPRIHVEDHCNGLILLDHCIVNPATREWALLPPRPPLPQPPPPGEENVFTYEYLVFDPTLSPKYELLVVPIFSVNLNGCEESEWPPSTLILSVFSSTTGSWEERTFSRDGVTARMLPGMVGSVQFQGRQCGYWRDALYIGCSDNFIMRISLSDNTYGVIRLLTEDGEPTEDPKDLFLGKSVKGIYCASLFKESQLQVWFLNDQTEWVLKHDSDILPIMPNLNEFDIDRDGPWILQEFDYLNEAAQYSDEDFAEKDCNKGIVEDNFEWDSDNDDVLKPGNRSE